MTPSYMRLAWDDLRTSPGLAGKLAVLTLLAFIPVFGWIVVLGYALGWARDAAWNIPGTLPARIFANEDGQLYRRGFFACVIAVLFSLLAWGLLLVVRLAGHLIALFNFGSVRIFDIFFGVMCAALIGIFVCAMLFSWVGMMRMSIYGRLSPGLQVNRIASMAHYDTPGLMRILGVSCLFALGEVFILLVVLIVVGGALTLVSAALFGGGMLVGLTGTYSSAANVGVLLPSVLVSASASLLFVVFVTLLTICMILTVFRALGYWTSQFDVAHWRGQDDPLPFEESVQGSC